MEGEAKNLSKERAGTERILKAQRTYRTQNPADGKGEAADTERAGKERSYVFLYFDGLRGNCGDGDGFFKNQQTG